MRWEGRRGVKRDVWCRGRRGGVWREGGEVRKKQYTVSYSSSISNVEPIMLMAPINSLQLTLHELLVLPIEVITVQLSFSASPFPYCS